MCRFLPASSWQEPLNWNLQATSLGEIQIPFHHYVRPHPKQQPWDTFSLFPRLPKELQLQILQHCDSATLFHLMRASPDLRNEAKKIFWCDTNAWYYTDGGWLLAGGYNGHHLHDPGAFGYIRQIEINFSHIDPVGSPAWNDSIHEYISRPPASLLEQHRRRFWQVLQQHFPKATSVVLSAYTFDDTGLPPPATLIRLAECCPVGITAFISCIQHEKGRWLRLTRILWKMVFPASAGQPGWVLVYRNWTRQSVLLPPKIFRGPIGALCRYQYLHHCKNRRLDARWLLLVQGLERYYFLRRMSCACPSANCDLKFKLPGELGLHMIDFGHKYEDATLVDELKASFESHSASIERIDHQQKEIEQSQKVAWEEEGTKQRESAENTVLYQLKHDLLYVHEKPLRESSMWTRYQFWMDGKTDDQHYLF